jgi:broad specificity phosphatase PhoE
VRVAAWLEQVVSKLGTNNVLIAVSHGGTIDQLMRCLSGSPLEASARAFIRCDVGHYHLWSRLQVEGRLVWRLDAVNRGPGGS